MDSKEDPNADGQRHNTATENSDTMALHKKRARRVSFAEMTSVHFFDRDDEEYNETPLMETAKIGDDSAGALGLGGQLERNKEFGGEDDGGGGGGDDNDDDEEMEMQRSFLRPMGSPSPGGSTFGSASSNDEDNFFGPVSANFIRPGRLSDSAASDDNHDVTMDSTAFSMHYRSLARSELGMDLKTPTGGPLFSEEKTPTSSTIGSSMVFTLGKKPIQKSSMPVTELSGSHSSNDMSLVGENPNKYDYEKLSPALDALLAESHNNLLYASVSDDITSVSPKMKTGQVLSAVDHGNNLVTLSDSMREEKGWINFKSVLNGDESVPRDEFGEANGPHEIFISGGSPKRFSTSTLGAVADRDNYTLKSSPYQLSKNESGTSLVASTSSPAKQQQNLLTAASSSKTWGAVSPLPEQPGSLLKTESVGHQETETSIQKSISKLELLKKSAFSNGSLEHQETETSIQKSISKLELLEKSAFSTFSAKVDNSTVKSLDFLKSPNFDNFFEQDHHISQVNSVEDYVTEEKLASVHQSTESIDHAWGENHLDEPLGQIMNGKSPNELRAKNTFVDESQSGPIAASPSKITWSGNHLIRSLFTSNHNNEDSLMTETESLLAKTASGEGGKAITSRFVSPPARMLEKKLPASPGLQSSQSEDLLLQSQFKQIADFDKGQDSTPERNFAHVNLSSATANMVAVSRGMKGVLNSLEVNHLNLIESKATDNREIDMPNKNEIIGTTGNFSTPAKENKSQVVHSENLDVGNLTSRHISSFEGDMPRIESRMVSHDFISPSASRNLDQPKMQNLVQFTAVSPSRKELDNKHPSRIPSPKTIQLSVGLENFSMNKRNLESLLSNTQHRTEITIMERSPKLQKAGNYDPDRIVYPIEGRTKLTGHEKKKLTDTYSKFTEDMKNLIFGSADKLNSKMIDVLEDMLVHQQRSKVYEMLHHGVIPQNAIVQHDLQLEKIAETNSLLDRVVFEKAKLQLKHVMRERVLKRLEVLSTRMQESQISRANIASLPLETCTSRVQADAVGDQSLSVNLKKEHEVCHEKLAAMEKALEASDREILNLMRTFHACCKMKAETGSGDTIASVNEHLIKRASFRFIRMDVQMWVVQSVGSVNGQHDVFLNYLDFIIQSTKIIVGPTSSGTTSFKLNETKIIKNFPNMDACVAFAFVFNAETARKYIGPKTLVQETQVTSSLLGTLLDVVEEVQLAKMEFLNLTQSNFCSPTVERLDLVLCFFNFNSGRKVILTLDMSCLKRGIYPSEILPLQLASPVDSQNCSSSGPIFDEIRNAIKGVRSGYMRILRLCRCVSQVVQASTA